MSTEPYPVRVILHPDDRLSRWQWIVKRIIALPHYIVLLGLLVASVISTVGAWFAILLTGKYPRTLWDFNVGVQRWMLRVDAYASLFMTDRYPPFTLEDDPTYPIRLLVRRPRDNEYNRVTVLFRLLLALPWLVVLGLLEVSWRDWERSQELNFDWQAFVSGEGAHWSDQFLTIAGMFGVIVGISILLLGRYPQILFRFSSAYLRIYLRVYTYAFLLVDPFPTVRSPSGEDEVWAPPPVVYEDDPETTTTPN